MFSNILLKLGVEIPAKCIPVLIESLKKSEIFMANDVPFNVDGDNAQVSLVISFIHNDPDLIIPLVDFPG